jgi:hypothetical protein
VGFNQALQAELRGTGVYASAVCSGFVANEGMWARLDRKVHVLFGLSQPEQVARAVVRAIRGQKVELLVNPLPARPVIATWALAPRVGRWLFRTLGIDAFMRGAALQQEAQDGIGGGMALEGEEDRRAAPARAEAGGQ